MKNLDEATPIDERLLFGCRYAEFVIFVKKKRLNVTINVIILT